MVHVLGKMWLFLFGNGAETRPLEMGRKSPDNNVFLVFQCGQLL